MSSLPSLKLQTPLSVLFSIRILGTRGAKDIKVHIGTEKNFQLLSPPPSLLVNETIKYLRQP